MMMGAVLGFTASLESQVCINCGVQFAIPTQLNHQLRQTKATFYCPNGHGQIYSESEVDRLKLQLEAAEQREKQARAEAAQARTRADNAEGREMMAKKKLARVKNGVCPCCNRSFVALQRHMKTKHPEFKR